MSALDQRMQLQAVMDYASEEISEDMNFASWNKGLEHALFEAIRNGYDRALALYPGLVNMVEEASFAEKIAEIARASEGLTIWMDRSGPEDEIVPMEEFERRHADWVAAAEAERDAREVRRQIVLRSPAPEGTVAELGLIRDATDIGERHMRVCATEPAFYDIYEWLSAQGFVERSMSFGTITDSGRDYLAENTPSTPQP